MKINIKYCRKRTEILPPFYYGKAYTNYMEAYEIYYVIPFNYKEKYYLNN
jgi:hypothetical protein